MGSRVVEFNTKYWRTVLLFLVVSIYDAVSTVVAKFNPAVKELNPLGRALINMDAPTTTIVYLSALPLVYLVVYPPTLGRVTGQNVLKTVFQYMAAMKIIAATSNTLIHYGIVTQKHYILYITTAITTTILFLNHIQKQIRKEWERREKKKQLAKLPSSQ